VLHAFFYHKTSTLPTDRQIDRPRTTKQLDKNNAAYAIWATRPNNKEHTDKCEIKSIFKIGHRLDKLMGNYCFVHRKCPKSPLARSEFGSTATRLLVCPCTGRWRVNSTANSQFTPPDWTRVTSCRRRVVYKTTLLQTFHC